MAVAADRPITGGGGSQMMTIHLPPATKPAGGEFTVQVNDSNVPFATLVIEGPPSIESIERRADGSFAWRIDRGWSISIE